MPLISFQVPERYQPGFEKIISLSEEDFLSIINKLNEVPLSLNTEEILTDVSSNLPRINLEDAKEILEALRSLYSLREATNISVERLIEGLYKALLENLSDLSTEQQTRLRTRLIQLLHSDNSLGIAAKARSLIDYERVYMGGRVLTDMRPMLEQTNQDLQGFVITNVLKIVYSQATTSEVHEFFVFMDETDLQQLRETIELAEEKIKNIKSMLVEKDIPYLSAE
jgi:hypothetical protein